MNSNQNQKEEKCVPGKVQYEGGELLSPKCINCRAYFADRENPPTCSAPSQGKSVKFELRDVTDPLISICPTHHDDIRKCDECFIKDTTPSQEEKSVCCGAEMKATPIGIAPCDVFIGCSKCGKPFIPSQEEKKVGILNLMKLGEITACGHCDDRFIEGLKQALEKVPNFKCDCKCHNKEEPRCTKCNSPFQSHHKINTSSEKEGFYHTGCLPLPPTKEVDWQIEFTNLFKLLIYGRTPPQDFENEIEKFIFNLLSSQQNTWKRKIEGLKRFYDNAELKEPKVLLSAVLNLLTNDTKDNE